MPGPWNDATDRQLLMTIIHLTAPQLPKWDKVAELMGGGYTAESTRQHFQKMRKDCKTKFGEPGNGGAAKGENGTAKSTPRKRQPTNGETPGKSTGKRKGKSDDHAVGEDDDDEENASPSKKVKAESEESNDIFS